MSSNNPSLLEKKEQAATIYTVDAVTPSCGKIFLFMKRAFDLIFSLTALIFLTVPMLIVGLLVKLDSKGPVIFKQERLGKEGKPFTIYKFRSMYTDAEKEGPQWATLDDNRCTKIGKKLRKTRIDELPQLFNILKGDMSFVGPRPERSCFYEEFETYIHGFSYRLVVKPGLTGYAQINGGYDLKPEEKILYDMKYIGSMSVSMDLKCIFKTISLIFTHNGAR